MEKYLNRALRFSGSSVLPAYPGFIVMKMPTEGQRFTSSPKKLNLFFLSRMASWILLTCILKKGFIPEAVELWRKRKYSKQRSMPCCSNFHKEAQCEILAEHCITYFSTSFESHCQHVQMDAQTYALILLCTCN